LRFQSLIEAFIHQVHAQPDRVALIVEPSENALRSITWRELSAAVAGFAAELSTQFESDPAVGRRIGHASDNSYADVVIALASMSIGAVEVPIDHRLQGDEIDRRRKRVGGLWVEFDARKQLPAEFLYSHASTAPSRNGIGAPSLILWTSGTTGVPQGVTLSQRNLAGNAAAKLAAVPQRRDDIRLCVLPLSHAYARTCDFGTWLLSGCTLALTLGHAGLCRLAPMIRPTLLNTVPSLAYRLLEEDPESLGLERLRLLGCGGAAISQSAFGQWKDRGVTVIQGYGLTETAPVISSATPEDASPSLVGCLVDGWEMDLRDGQLFVRGSHAMLGYWDDERGTAEKIDADGWLATGDLVEQDASTGQLRILGRVDDVIVLDCGSKVFPSTIQREVEQIAGVGHAILVHRDRLQLWFDADEGANHDEITTAIGQLLDQHRHHGEWEIHRFARPLCEASGELTAKGTIRRAQILQNRFSI
jgi:long-chain acyl-CoA synthetase